MEAALLSLLALLALLFLVSPAAAPEPKRIVIIEPEVPTSPSFGPIIVIVLIVLFVLLAR